jgi:hypothetical protein
LGQAALPSTLVRCFATGTGIRPDALGSFFIVKVRGDTSGQAFDYGDLYHTQSAMLRRGDVAFIACFNDGGNAGLFLKQKLDRITGAVSNMQLRELATELAFLNVHLKQHLKLQSYFDLDLERHEMRGTFVMPELGDLDYAIRGKLMHYAFHDMFGLCARHIASISALLNWSGRALSGKRREAIDLGGGVHLFPNRRQLFKKAPRFAMKRAPHVELRVAQRRKKQPQVRGLRNLAIVPSMKAKNHPTDSGGRRANAF